MNPSDVLKRPAIVLLCALMIGGGCTSTTQVKTGRHDQFRNSLVETCHLIQMSQFDRAKVSLSDSRSLAMNDRHISKVDDLQRILRGAESMHSGNPSSAAEVWLEIRDVNLKQQFVDLGIEKGIDLKAIADAGTRERRLKP